MANKKPLQDIVDELVDIARAGTSTSKDRKRAGVLGKMILAREQELINRSKNFESAWNDIFDEAFMLKSDMDFLANNILTLWNYMNEHQQDRIEYYVSLNEIAKENMITKLKNMEAKKKLEQEENKRIEKGYNDLFGIPTDE